MATMSDAPEARLSRPMDLGAILDGAFSLYRRHFVVIVASVGILVVPLALIGIALGPIGVLMPYFAALITPAIGALVVADAAVGRQPAVGSIWARVVRMLIPLIVTAVLTFITVVIGLVLLIIPGVLFYVWFALSAQAVAMGEGRYFSAMGRSRRLVKGSWWRVFGILIVIGIVAYIAQQLVEALVLVALHLAGVGSGATGLAGDSQGFAVAIVLALTASMLLIAPITALATSLLYFDLRLRKEGTDISAAVDALG
jgi:hypothetical protein